MDPFIGQISIVAFDFAPKGFAFCDGQLLGIAQNTALFSLIGTFYGGNGVNTFALPNLQGRAPVHMGSSFAETISIGQAGGEVSHALTTSELPAHSHPLLGSTDAATSTTPQTNVLASKAATRGSDVYAAPPANQALSPTAIGPAGGNQPHNNVQPSLCVNFIIALFGIFPSRN